jgi:hypothetical protein
VPPLARERGWQTGLCDHRRNHRDGTLLRMLTTIRSKKKPSRTYLWTFIAGDFVGYRFSASRLGATPKEVLGGTQGTLVVDAYTGYYVTVRRRTSPNALDPCRELRVTRPPPGV